MKRGARTRRRRRAPSARQQAARFVRLQIEHPLPAEPAYSILDDLRTLLANPSTPTTESKDAAEA